MSLTEKYRPKRWEDIKGQDHIIEQLKDMCQRQTKMPHLLFSGPAGTGKTTVAHLIGRTLFGPNYKTYFKEFNASDARKIDDIREKIKPLSRSSVPVIIFLDEVDGMLNDSQQALRRIMETSPYAIFILACNRVTKIIEPITSRCTIFTFKKLSDAQIVEILCQVITNEGIEVKTTNELREAVMEIVRLSDGDARKSMNLLEKIITSKKELNVKTVLESKQVEMAGIALQTALTGDFEKAMAQMEDAYLNDSEVDNLIDQLWKSAKTIPDYDVKIRIFYELGQLEHRIHGSHRPLYQLISFISYAYVCPRLRR